MSETVHYKGTAIRVHQPNDKNLIQVAEDILKERNIKIEDYYENAIECLCDELSDEYFFYPKHQYLYAITKEHHDPNDDIIEADVDENGEIQYELRYYNGGAGFSECLEEALDGLDLTNQH